jgi:HSP20 family protein
MNELARMEPFKALDPFHSSLFDVIPSFFRPAQTAALQGPRMDVAEDETRYYLAVELPGIPKEAIQVSVYENSVSVGAEANSPQPQQQQNWLLRERSFGKISRNISLPEAVDDTSSEARYAEGMLYLTLQKKRASQVKRLTIQ